MRLTAQAVLEGVAHALREQISPALQDPFAIEAARLATALATICANGADDAVAVRVEEHAKIRALFTEAAPVISDAALATSLKEAAQSRDPGLRISELDTETARLRRLLVALHAHVERQADEAAQRIDRQIWTLLGETEASRAPRG